MASKQWRRQSPSTVFKAFAVLARRKSYADPLGVLELKENLKQPDHSSKIATARTKPADACRIL